MWGYNKFTRSTKPVEHCHASTKIENELAELIAYAKAMQELMLLRKMLRK